MTLTRSKAKGGQASSGPPEREATLVPYEADPHAWAAQQAGLLRNKRLDMIDVDNIADEIADVGRREARAVRSGLRLILQHLLKWDGQPQGRSRSWMLTIRAQRRAVERQLDENPSLRSQLPKLVAQAYEDGRDAALDETNLPEAAIPPACPYSWDDIMSRPITWPEP